ncbi:hypothetical protein N7490_002620 [Penicillium lividum]|nr:hypothetical protein N7490_002620 [Penicillium lividum]
MADASESTRCSLPTDKVFSIQIGQDLFRLSGASIASDAPSYFSRFFEEQMRFPESHSIRTLYIDRDPETFKEIARHLQGYHVRPRDGAQFVKLFADAQFYSLPRLISQLFESEIFIQIGDRHFQIPRDIFSSPGDSPNFFTLGFGAFFASPSEIFPGLDRVGLLRPPAITPPGVPNRSAEVFAELLHMLRGYPLHIRNDDHRAELLRDCRYFHLRGLEQKLIPHNISVNPFNQRSEIAIRLEDVRPSGIQLAQNSIKPNSTTRLATGGLVMYARPFVDDKPFDLMLEIGGESTIISRAGQLADFIGQTKSRMASLIQVVGKKTNLPDITVAGLPLKVRLGRDADITIDGERDPQRIASLIASGETDNEGPPAKRQRSDGSDDGPWVVRTGQWRLLVQQVDPTGPFEVVLIAQKLDVYTHPRTRNQIRDFL